MRCLICGNQIENFGNNPFPLCSVDDYESRCCDICNEFVIKARIASMKKDNNINVGDTLVIFYAKSSDSPTNTISENGKFLAGIVENVYDKQDGKLYEGTWGSFIVDSKTDQYVKV